MAVSMLGQYPEDTSEDDPVCCCDCCQDCACCSCHIPSSQASAKRWQIADLTLSTFTLGGCAWYLQWYFMRNLWLYFAGAAFLTVSCIGAVVTTSMGICCLRRHRTGYLGARIWATFALTGGCLIIFAGHNLCEEAECRARPDYCFYWGDDYGFAQSVISVPQPSNDRSDRRSLVEGNVERSFYDDDPSDDYIWYDDLWYDNYWYDDYWYSYYGYDDYGYYMYWYDGYWDNYHSYDPGWDDDGDDDFFKYMCMSQYCEYDGIYEDEHFHGNVCFNTGYQDCDKKWGSKFEASFHTRHDHWHGFDGRAKCNRYFAQHLLLAKLPLASAALVLLVLRGRMAFVTRVALHAIQRRQITELATIMHSTQSQVDRDELSQDTAIEVVNPTTQYRLLTDDSTATVPTRGPHTGFR